jgi:uncharacterized protein (DUF433 family)
MARYPLNLPPNLKQEAEVYAQRQGVSLNQFILWSVAEKVGELKQSLDDPNFPDITYRRSASGVPTPIISGRGIRVQTLVIARNTWKMSVKEVADEYSLDERVVKSALDFYMAHQAEIDTNIASEQALQDAR